MPGVDLHGVDLTGAKTLIVDDEPANIDVLHRALEGAGYEVLVVTDGEQALAVAAREHPDLVLLDVAMPGIDGIETCKRFKADPELQTTPVIFLTASIETSIILDGFRVGGVDYIAKPFEKDEVLARVRTHLQNAYLARALTERNAELAAEIDRRTRLDGRLTMIARKEDAHWGVDGFVGESATIRSILAEIDLLRKADIPVLITGESGTGKELIARAVHTHSRRAGNAFVPVNCATIPAQLAESLFFGHRKGSFTGAEHDQTGYFEMADGGTLFLDEVGAMPPELQPKLLRVLEDGLIRPLGASVDHHVDVRVLAATNAPESFREDLYHRLARFTVELPPLRQRHDDIPLLARHFLSLFAAEMGLEPPELTQAAMEQLLAYDFPGNVRELKNVIEQALITSRGGAIQPQHLRLRPPPEEPRTTDELPLNLADAEMVLIRRALDQADGNVSAAARLLGVDRNVVYRRLADE